jgi:GTP cyclohydrolase II
MEVGATATLRSVARIPLAGVGTPVRFYTFDGLSKSDHFAVRFGHPGDSPLVRIHSECVTGDVFGSLRCDCGSQLRNAINQLDDESGWLLYLRQEGRGIGLAAKLDAYVLQEGGMDTFAANQHLGYGEDERDYADAVGMLEALGIARLRLMTQNSEKASALNEAGILVDGVVPCRGTETVFNSQYLAAKRERNRPFEG